MSNRNDVPATTAAHDHWREIVQQARNEIAHKIAGMRLLSGDEIGSIIEAARNTMFWEIHASAFDLECEQNRTALERQQAYGGDL